MNDDDSISNDGEIFPEITPCQKRKRIKNNNTMKKFEFDK